MPFCLYTYYNLLIKHVMCAGIELFNYFYMLHFKHIFKTIYTV